MPEERGLLGDSWAFTKSLGKGVWDAGTGLVEGVGELAKGGYALATDEKARESAWKTTKKIAEAAGDYGEEVWDDPAKAYRDARDGTLAAYNSFEQAKEKAAAEGRSAEFWGDLAGKGIFEIGSTIIPVGVAAKAGKLGKVAKGAKQLENSGDMVSASKKAEKVVKNSDINAPDTNGVKIECPLKDCETNNKDIRKRKQELAEEKKAAKEVVRKELEGIASKKAEILKNTLSNKKRGPVLTILKDMKTGKIFDEINVNEVPDNLHKILKKRLENMGSSPHPSTPGTHSEIIAIDKALKTREAAGIKVTEDDLADFVLYNETLYRNKTGSVPCCANCTKLIDGVESLSGKLTTWSDK